MHTWVAVPSLRLTVPHRLLLNLEVRLELTFGWNLQISGSVCETEPLYYNFTSITSACLCVSAPSYCT